MQKRFHLPAHKAGEPPYSCQSFVLRELTAGDQREAALWADRRRDATSDSPLAQFQQERFEALRLSLVEVDGKPVNQDGIPFLALDDWTYRTLVFARLAFNSLNGADDEALEGFLAGAEIVADNAPHHLSDAVHALAAATGGSHTSY